MPSYLADRFTNKGLENSLPVLRALEQMGPMSQAQIAAHFTATQPFANAHLRHLHHEGLVYPKTAKTPSGGGRPYQLWDVNRESNLTIGFSWDVAEVIMGLADFTGTIELSARRALKDVHSHDQIFQTVDAFIDQCLRIAQRTNQTIRMCCIGAGGHIDPDTGEILDCVSDPRLDGINFEEHVRQRFGLKCMVHGRFAPWYGEARLTGDETLVVVTWENGISVQTGCQDELFFYSDQPGNRYRGAWSVGHIVVEKDGKPCHCGQKGCLEAYVGGRALQEALDREDICDIADLVSAGQRDDPQVLEALGEAAYILGKSLTWHVQFMGVEKIVVTGTLSVLFDKVRDRFVQGLRTLLDEDWVRQLDPRRPSDDPVEHAISGACYMAQRMFFDAKRFEKIRRESSEYYKNVVYPKRQHLRHAESRHFGSALPLTAEACGPHI